MTYLITGASGFVGRALAEHLLRRGDSIHYLGRKRSQALPKGAIFHSWAPGEVPQLQDIGQVDGVFHLAGEPVAQRWTEEVKKRIYSSRVEGTRNLVNALRQLEHRPSVFVSASAVGYYGDRGSEALTEAQVPGEDFLAEVCKAWEQEAFRAHDLGMRVVPIRIATVLGRKGGALKQMLPPFRLGIGGRFGNGKQWMSWIHLVDLVRLLLFAADSTTLEEPLNGSSPQPVTNTQFTKALADALHRPALIPVPKFAMKVLLGEMADFLFKSQRVIPQAAERAGFAFQYSSIEEALQSLV
ncbi:MAG: TIGR01777 family oxidoreductase [Acidobacteriota bacterium]|nr:TIGR01777 family oxidoreductase [Acidobacteriota bacterium]